jgi:hypothetical protein
MNTAEFAAKRLIKDEFGQTPVSSFVRGLAASTNVGYVPVKEVEDWLAGQVVVEVYTRAGAKERVILGYRLAEVELLADRSCPVGRFILENLVRDPADFITNKQFYEEFKLANPDSELTQQQVLTLKCRAGLPSVQRYVPVDRYRREGASGAVETNYAGVNRGTEGWTFRL